MAKTRCWLGFNPRPRQPPTMSGKPTSGPPHTTPRSDRRNPNGKSDASQPPLFEWQDFTLNETLLRILRGDDFDLDQESGIGQRCDANHGTRREIWLRAAEELGVALHEGLEVHRRAGVVDQK